MHFQMSAAITGHARAHTNVGHTRPGLAVYLGAEQVHALELHPGSRRIQLTPQFLPVQHPSGNLERPPEQVLRQGKITGIKGLTYPRTADANTIQLNRAGSLDAEAFALTGLGQKGKVTGAVTAEAKVITHFQMLHTQTFNQHTMHELSRAQLTQAAVETQAQHSINTFGSQQSQLVAQPRQARRCYIRCKKLARLRLKNQHATGHAKLGGTLTQTRQNGLMTTMVAVEIPDGGDTAPMLGPQVV